MKNGIKRAIWGSMLTADMNVRYWTHLGRRYYKREQYTKVFLACMSSGTVASWSFWNQFGLIWKVLSVIAALTAIALPILNFSKMIEIMADLKQHWTEITNEHELLWATRKTKNIDILEQKYEEIKKREGKLSRKEANMPNNKKLLYKSREEVLQSRGL